MGIVNYSSFILSVLLLNLIPGSDTIFILSKATVGGRKQGIISVLGISSGIFVHTCLAAVGLSAILMTSALAFNLLKWLGAAYLVYLGIASFLKKETVITTKQNQLTSAYQVYRQGLLTNVLNPKVALFFLSLLPQYVDPSVSNSSGPFFILGMTFLITSTIWSICVVYGASFFSSLFNKNVKSKQMANKVTGIVYIALGLHLLKATVRN